MSIEHEPPLEGEIVEGFDDLSGDERAGEPALEAQLVRNGPALARMAAGMWWRTTRWGVGVCARTGARLMRAAADPVLAAEVVDDLGRELRDYARDLLGITELNARLDELAGPTHDESDTRRQGPPLSERDRLRIRGARLLRAAAEIDPADEAHPAYARILTELAPDEGRILRLFATEGSQASVDVRAANLIGVGSELVAGGLNMIGAQAGLAHRDRISAYLNNLERLGLVWFSHEPLDDPVAYQVLEAQPNVLEAMRSASRTRTQQRSIHLTPFGEDFCAVCLPLDTAEAEVLAARDPALGDETQSG